MWNQKEQLQYEQTYDGRKQTTDTTDGSKDINMKGTQKCEISIVYTSRCNEMERYENMNSTVVRLYIPLGVTMEGYENMNSIVIRLYIPLGVTKWRDMKI